MECNKPSQPCLSSRFPYDELITLEKLQRVARCERYLRQLGVKNLRVPSADDVARIELPPAEITAFVQTTDLPALVAAFQDYGFTYVTLDLEDYRSGKLNQELSTQANPANPSRTKDSASKPHPLKLAPIKSPQLRGLISGIK